MTRTEAARRIEELRPRMPDTPERARLERQRSIREIVFGAQDGLLTTLGIVTGVGSANPDRATILLTGGISLIVGAISMGVGEYLGGKAEREVVENAIAYERQEMIDKPDEEYAEQVGYYRLKGFPADEATAIVDRLTQLPDIWLHEMVRDEFGVDPRIVEGGGLRAPLSMAGSFAAGALVPIVPYFFAISHQVALVAGLICAVCALFAVGFIAGRLGGRNPVAKGLEIVVYGTVVFAISFAAGQFLPPLFGKSAIGVGG